MAHVTPWVRQYTLRDLLDDSFDLFKDRASTLLLAALLPYLLVVVYVLVMRQAIFPGDTTLLSTDWTSSAEQLYSILQHNAPFLLYLIGLCCMNAIALLIGYIAQCRIAARHALGLPVSLRDAFRLLAKPFWSSILIYIIYSLMLVVAMVAVIICIALISLVLGVVGLLAGGSAGATFTSITVTLASIILTFLGMAIVTACFLSAPISLAVDHTGPFAAISVSFSTATKNFKAHLYALLVVCHVPVIFSLLAMMFGFLLQYATHYFSPTITIILGLVVSAVCNIIIAGYLASFQSLAYIDGRCRKDNLDLILLAREIGMGNDVEQLFLQGTSGTPQFAYPDYAAATHATSMPVAGSIETGTSAVAVAPAYPDYSAPPPPVTPEEERPQGDADAE